MGSSRSGSSITSKLSLSLYAPANNALRRSSRMEGFGSWSADETVSTSPTESTSKPKHPPELSSTRMSCGALLRRQAQQLAQAHRGEHVAAIVNQPAHKAGRQRNRLRPRRANDFKNVGDGNAEQGLSQAHGTHLHHVRRRFSLRFNATLAVLMPRSPLSGSTQRESPRRQAAAARCPDRPRRSRGPSAASRRRRAARFPPRTGRRPRPHPARAKPRCPHDDCPRGRPPR